MNFKISPVILFLLGFMALASCRNNEQQTEETQETVNTENNTDANEQEDVLSTIYGVTNLSRFTSEIDNSRASDLQQGDREYTVFAPRNAAFAPLYDETGNRLTVFSDIDVLQYHVVQEKYTQDELTEDREGENGSSALTLGGERLQFEQQGDTTFVMTGTGTRAAIIESYDASNGVVHVINELLLPMEATQGNNGQPARGN